MKEILPAGTVEEVLNDGKDGKVRQLRDFLVLLKQFDRQRTALMEKHQTASRHKQDVEAAVADAKKQVQFRQDELAALKTELTDMNRQRDAALAHEKAIEKQLAESQDEDRQVDRREPGGRRRDRQGPDSRPWRSSTAGPPWPASSAATVLAATPRAV